MPRFSRHGPLAEIRRRASSDRSWSVDGSLGFFREDYARESYETLLLLVLASPIILVNTIFTTDLRAAKRIKPLLIIATLSSGSTLLADYILLPGKLSGGTVRVSTEISRRSVEGT